MVTVPAQPLKIDVYTKAFDRVGRLGAPKFVTLHPRHNALSTATVSVLSTDRLVPRLIAAGGRMVINDEYGDFLMSGKIVRARGRGPQRAGLIEFDVEDDFRILMKVLGWVQPDEPINNQGIAGSNWEMTGSAESVLKAAVQANAVDRLGLPLTVATDLDRGSEITAKLRFHTLFDRIFPVKDGAGFDASGLGATVRQVGTGLVLDVYETGTYPRTLTESSGVVHEWSYSTAGPTATRVVIGGQGEAQLRAFRTVERTDLEDEYGDILEVFRDARDTNDNTLLYQRGNETLDEGGPKSGLSMTLSSTPNFRYGKDFRVGDTVTVNIGGHEITDTLREATLSWTHGDGWKATPKIGDLTDDPDTMLMRAVRSIARTLSTLNRT